jgi:hypothetical protein
LLSAEAPPRSHECCGDISVVDLRDVAWSLPELAVGPRVEGVRLRRESGVLGGAALLPDDLVGLGMDAWE